VNVAHILCEGFHDRAFWAGLVTCLGCLDARERPGNPTPGEAFDPTGKPVKGQGQYAYYTNTNNFVLIVPCFGKDRILEAMRLRVRNHIKFGWTQLIVNVDPDITPGSPTVTTGIRVQDVLHQVQQEVPSAIMNSEGRIEFDGGVKKVCLVRWETDDNQTPGLPNQQTLERLVCASIIAAYPERGECVQNWLASRKEPPNANVKEYSWSYMAGWYADNNCEGFYHRVWEDEKVAEQLKARMEKSGAWQIAEALAI
jgi:hypothetical protein